MKLKAYQENILALLKGNKVNYHRKETYFTELKKSDTLSLVKEIIIWWRLFQLEQYCPITSSLLKKMHLFEDYVNIFYRENNVSSYIEELGLDFLQFSANKTTGNIKSIAEFEYALIKIKSGNKNTFYVEWDSNPYALLAYILKDQPMQDINHQKYITKISAKIPNLFEVSLQAENCLEFTQKKVSKESSG